MAEKCPGLYCGRQNLGNDTWSDCGACPRGFQVEDSRCVPCIDHPTTYDWLYLGFMALMPLIGSWFFIDMAAKEQSFTKGQLILHFSALVEVIISAVITLFIYDPVFSFNIYSCEVTKLSDWYTLFHNPSPNYADKLYCTQEAVFPLQTMVLVFYLLCIVTMMVIRPCLNRIFLKKGKSAVYCSLYFIPVLSLLHTVAGGLIYYSFPYLSVIISMISNAVHFSLKLDQSMKSLILSSVKEMKNTVVIIGHWVLLAYGIISLHQHLAFLAFVPFPAIFYIITVKFTDPGELHMREERKLAAGRKHNKYKALKERNYNLLPFVVETLGPWCKEAISFTDKIGKLLMSTTGEIRSKEFFKKNISIAIQRGNAASIMATYPYTGKLDEVFYIL